MIKKFSVTVQVKQNVLYIIFIVVLQFVLKYNIENATVHALVPINICLCYIWDVFTDKELKFVCLMSAILTYFLLVQNDFLYTNWKRNML